MKNLKKRLDLLVSIETLRGQLLRGARPQPPQAWGFPSMAVSQPSPCLLPLQSAKPASQVPTVEAYLSQIGRSLRDVATVALTHGHQPSFINRAGSLNWKAKT